MNIQFRPALAVASLCAGLVMMMASQAQQPPYPGYGYGPHGMWQQLTPEQQQQMWENMHRGGYGPGMMGGYGPGYGMGPGMMGSGYGPGCGMGPGMMGGYGPGCGMGSGMMGGYGPGYGMGHGMMGGYGPGYGMGPGMMGGWAGLNLSEAQTAQIGKIRDNLREKHRKLMDQMWDEQAKLAKLYNAEKLDSAAIGKAHDNLSKLQREALEARIDAENKAADVLTTEQKAQLRGGFGRGMMGY